MKSAGRAFKKYIFSKKAFWITPKGYHQLNIINNKKMKNKNTENKEKFKEFTLKLMQLLNYQRENLGITQVELADQIGIEQGNLSRLFKSENVELTTFFQILEGLGGKMSIEFSKDNQSLIPNTPPFILGADTIAANKGEPNGERLFALYTHPPQCLFEIHRKKPENWDYKFHLKQEIVYISLIFKIPEKEFLEIMKKFENYFKELS